MSLASRAVGYPGEEFEICRDCDGDGGAEDRSRRLHAVYAIKFVRDGPDAIIGWYLYNQLGAVQHGVSAYVFRMYFTPN